MLRSHGLPDVLGLQEFTRTQLRIFNQLAGATYATFGSKDNHIAWRRDRFTLLDRQFLTIPYFGGQPRKMPIITLQDRTTGRVVTIINVHNPVSNKRRGNDERHRRTAVKREIAAAQAALTGGSTAAVLLGDFNERDQAYCQITRGGLLAANGGQPASTGTCKPPTTTIIDWIFGTGLPLSDYTVDASVRGTISDHRLILATLG